MKKLLFIALLLPLGLMAQKDTGTIDPHSKLGLFSYRNEVGSTSGKWNFLSITPISSMTLTLRLFDNKDKNYPAKLLMEIDTAGKIHVYGDTLSVLKAIIRSYNIKVKD